jgi:hypothetical protein
MFNSDYIITEFDEQNRILHTAYSCRVHPTSETHLNIIFSAYKEKVAQFAESGRVYLIIDMSNLIIEPDLKAAYAAQAKDIIEKYIMPHGVARYGFQITRITVRAGYDRYMHDAPNIFNSKEEAYDYIYSLIKKEAASPQV